MRFFVVPLFALCVTLAGAQQVTEFRAGLNCEFDLVSGNYTSTLASGALTPSGPTLVQKAVGSLDITLDMGPFIGSSTAVPITMLGTELAGNEIQWTVNQNLDVIVTTSTGTRIRVRNVTGALLSHAKTVPWFFDQVAGQYYDVRFDGIGGNASNHFTITGTLPDLFNLPFSATIQDLVYFGYGGRRPRPGPGH